MNNNKKNDKYYNNMFCLIKSELNDRGLDKLVSLEAIEYLADSNLFIIDVLKIIDLIEISCKEKKQDCYELEDLKKIIKMTI